MTWSRRSFPDSGTVSWLPQVHPLVLHRPTLPPDEHVVEASPPPVRARVRPGRLDLRLRRLSRQLGVDRVALYGREFRFDADRVPPHHSHQAAYALAVDQSSSDLEPHGHPPAAVIRVGSVLPVDQDQVLGRLWGRREVETRPVESHQLSLPPDALPGVARLDQPQPVSRPGG